MAANVSIDDLRLERRANFIEQAVAIYGDRYDYSSIVYVDTKTPISLSCSSHGDFRIRPANHLNGQHCRECKRLENAEVNSQGVAQRFAEKARKVHGERFDYSRANETDERGRALIICAVHGEFWQFKGNHLSGRGCRACSNELKTTTVKEFIERSQLIHGAGTFDYSGVKQFATTRDKVAIICPEHGEFFQIARDHMRGVGCQACGLIRMRVSFSEFVERARAIHGDHYGYLEESWDVDPQFVVVICPSHGEYKQNWYNHSIGMGCARCRNLVSKPEIELFQTLSAVVTEEIRQSDRTAIRPKELDIWFPTLGLAVEFNGIAYHDKTAWIASLGSTASSREKTKSELCRSQGIRLIHLWEDDYKLDGEWWVDATLEAIDCARIEDLTALDRMIRRLELRASERIPAMTGQLGIGRKKKDD